MASNKQPSPVEVFDALRSITETQAASAAFAEIFKPWPVSFANSNRHLGATMPGRGLSGGISRLCVVDDWGRALYPANPWDRELIVVIGPEYQIAVPSLLCGGSVHYCRTLGLDGVDA